MWKRFKTWLGGKSGTPEPTPEGTPAAGNALVPADTLVEAYAELGVPEGTDLNTLRRVWKARLKEVHRDHYSEDPEIQRQAEERTRRLNEAYHVLRDALF